MRSSNVAPRLSAIEVEIAETYHRASGRTKYDRLVFANVFVMRSRHVECTKRNATSIKQPKPCPILAWCMVHGVLATYTNVQLICLSLTCFTCVNYSPGLSLINSSSVSSWWRTSSVPPRAPTSAFSSKSRLFRLKNRCQSLALEAESTHEPWNWADFLADRVYSAVCRCNRNTSLMEIFNSSQHQKPSLKRRICSVYPRLKIEYVVSRWHTNCKFAQRLRNVYFFKSCSWSIFIYATKPKYVQNKQKYKITSNSYCHCLALERRSSDV